MDLICDRVLSILADDRKREAIVVNVDFAAPRKTRASIRNHHPSPMAVMPSTLVNITKTFSFEPVFECDRDPRIDVRYVISAEGVRYFPKQDVVQAMVSTWLDEVSEAGREISIGSAETEVIIRAFVGSSTPGAAVGGLRPTIYKKRLSLQCEFSGYGGNKKMVNRITQELLRVKNMCMNILSHEPRSR